MKAIIYSRVSTEDQDNKRAIQELQEYAKYKKYKVLKVFQEKISGAVKAGERTEFKKMLEFIDTEKPDHILIWELSRLGRSMNNVIDTIEMFSEKGINIYCKKEGFNTLNEKTGKKDLMTGIVIAVLSGFAEMEKETIKVRSSSGIRANVIRGGSGTGVIKPYGFKKVDKMLVVDEEEAEVVKLMFRKYLSGLGTQKIANYLNELKIKTRFNKIFENKTLVQKHNFEKKGSEYKWKDGTVYCILTNTIYKGERVHKGEVFKVPAIIDSNTFDKVQKLLAKNNNKGASETVNQNILKDLLICGKCGRSYFMHKRKDNKDNAYKCLSKRYNEYCGNYSIGIDKLNDALFKVCQPMIFNDAIENIPATKKALQVKKENISIQLKTIENQVDSLERKLDKVLNVYLEGELTKAKYSEVKQAIEVDLSKAQEKKEQLTNELDKINSFELATAKNPNLYNYDMFKQHIKQAIESVRVFAVPTDTDVFKVKNDKCVLIQVKGNFNFTNDTQMIQQFILSQHSSTIAFPTFRKNFTDTDAIAGDIEKGNFKIEFHHPLDELKELKELKFTGIKKRN